MFVLDTLPPAEETAAADAAIEVTRWRGFRQDRAYVRRNGRHIGYRDLRTGRISAFRDADRDIVALATADLQRETAPAAR